MSTGSPYRAPPGCQVDVKVVVATDHYRLDAAAAQLARLLSEGYELVAHSGCCTASGTVRAIWTLVKAVEP